MARTGHLAAHRGRWPLPGTWLLVDSGRLDPRRRGVSRSAPLGLEVDHVGIEGIQRWVEAAKRNGPDPLAELYAPTEVLLDPR